MAPSGPRVVAMDMKLLWRGWVGLVKADWRNHERNSGGHSEGHDSHEGTAGGGTGRESALDVGRRLGLVGCAKGLPEDLSTNKDHFAAVLRRGASGQRVPTPSVGTRRGDEQNRFLPPPRRRILRQPR